MSSELYDKFARMNRIDQAIFESEQEIANGAEAVDAEIVFAELEKNILDKYKVILLFFALMSHTKQFMS